MSEEPTQSLTPFETTVLQRFDQIDTKLENTNVRLDKLEAKAMDTKPIWERALAEIVEVKGEIVEVKAEIVEVKAEILDVKDRVNKIERVLVGLFADLHEHDQRITTLEGTKPMIIDTQTAGERLGVSRL